MNPLRLAKQRMASYTSQLSGYSDAAADDELDIEKRRVSESDSDSDSDYLSSPISSSSTNSSRQTSQAHDPMLSRARSGSPSRRAKNHITTSYPKAPFRLRCCTLSPRWSSKVFELILFSILVIFITALTRSHWSSVKSVESGEHKPPPPPPVWESFPFLKRYHGGIRTLVSRAENKPEYPSSVEDEVASKEGQDAVEGGEKAQVKRAAPSTLPASKPFKVSNERSPIVDCHLDPVGKSGVPHLQVYSGVPSGMPEPIMGSYDLLGLNNDVCYERYGRLGPYGYGYSRRNGGSGAGMNGDREGIEAVWQKDDYVDYTSVNWANTTRRCDSLNQHRFPALPTSRRGHFYESMAVGGPHDQLLHKRDQAIGESVPAKVIPRKAVVIRTWHDFPYDDEDLFYLRSLITELSLQSGGEYTIHFLIHVKDSSLQIWADDNTYQRVLDESLPAEFKGMGTLWSEKQMELVYGGLEETHYRDLNVYGVYRSTFQPMTYFALMHPEYEYFWQLEMDSRYTGHWYHLFDKTSEWSAKQPRKGLWERNARFYIPSEHGSWEDFSHMVRVQTEHGTASKSNMYAAMANNPNVPDNVKAELEPPKPERAVWGPEPPQDDQLDTTHDAKPPTSEKDDKHTWGVDEEADLILFNPIFDPEGTNWILSQDVTGYNKTRGLPPRRTAINTFGRYSRKLLLQMHTDTAFARKSMFSEMWPASCALHHGFKAVYAPHPVFIDRKWPTAYLASIFNGGRNGAAGGARLSVFSDERQHNFRGTTWYYDAGFAPNLWKRWMGLKVDNDGGEEEEMLREGRMCLPAVLLHPVKHVDMLIEPDVSE